MLNQVQNILVALVIGLLAATAIMLGQTETASAITRLATGPAQIAQGASPPADTQHAYGAQECATCHAAEVEAWRGSQHAMAMQHADARTVRGDFNDVEVEHLGSHARFFRKGDAFMVTTDGPDGAPHTYEVTYTFGVEPLQQYLVAFPDGRIQALPFAWDSRPKAEGGQRWFHLYPDQPVPAGNTLHWTGQDQNWNHMCAECHSTQVRKGYDAATDSFHTRFSRINVGCAACHGDTQRHLEWAARSHDDGASGDSLKGFATMAARRPTPDWTPDPDTGSPAHGVSRPAGDEVETCARCHSRRSPFSEDWQPGHPLMDTHLPVLLSQGLFEDDGQMLDEVFNDHAFKQSLMYAKGVVCSDCHDPHSQKLKADGAQVCGQCHLPERFEAQSHTGHPPGKNAPDCISCHMPARTYMVVDERHDHSFRIPRPDLSVKFGTPNACTDCHADKSASWAAEAVERWHGPDRKGFQSWTEAFHRARAGQPGARELLLKLAADPNAPGIARATALSEAQQFPSQATAGSTMQALSDKDPMVRLVAVRALDGAPLEDRWRLASPLLTDPVAAVRMEAGLLLADQPLDALSEADRKALVAAMAAYEKGQRLNADRPDARANLASLLLKQNDPAGAEAELRAGLRLMPGATTLAVNLADLYRAQGREAEAEQLLRETIRQAPDTGVAHHALGLSLIRQKRYAEALEALKDGARLSPDQPHYSYVYAVALNSAGDPEGARRVIEEALKRHPYDHGLLNLALEDAMRQGQLARAADLARRLSLMVPDNPNLSRLADQLTAR
ncbi:MAG: tetratricopeptide repeat protein [Xanthobacter sp.]